jgi:hypothetical protein
MRAPNAFDIGSLQKPNRAYNSFLEARQAGQRQSLKEKYYVRCHPG